MKLTAYNVTLLLSTLMLASLVKAEESCAQTGPNAPLALHQHWIMEGWEKRQGDPEFVFTRKMGRYYDLEQPSGIFYDNFAPGETQLFDNALVYGQNWEGLQAQATSVIHALTEGHSQLLAGDVASTTLGFVGTIDPNLDSQLPFKGRSQLGWECDLGEWKIRQELNYAWVVEAADIAHYYDALQAQQ